MNKNGGLAIRDGRGRYLKGMPGGPGRPTGSRNKLTEEFLHDVHEAWLEHGREALRHVLAERPETFVAIVARIVDVRRIELGEPDAFEGVRSREDILRVIEERGGPRALEAFKRFIAHIDGDDD